MFPYPLCPVQVPAGDSPPQLWYVPQIAGGKRIHLTVLCGVPASDGSPRWVCYGPAYVKVHPRTRITCVPETQRSRCILMLLHYLNDYYEWMPRGDSPIERELLPHLGEGSSHG